MWKSGGVHLEWLSARVSCAAASIPSATLPALLHDGADRIKAIAAADTTTVTARCHRDRSCPCAVSLNRKRRRPVTNRVSCVALFPVKEPSPGAGAHLLRPALMGPKSDLLVGSPKS